MHQKSDHRLLAVPLPRRKLSGFGISQQTASALLSFLSVAALGLMLALQGWKSRPPAFDMLTYFHSAENLLKRGAPAAYGDISSYGSFSPPGTTWLMAPGMLVFTDPRLYEKLGAAALHLGTLLGIFLLAHEVLGRRCAYLCVAAYGLSGLGLAFAGSLWPIGHPFFYVWMVYFAVRWVSYNDPRYLAAALTTFAVGMYDDMAITPIMLILPALWIAYRPPVISRTLLAAGFVSLVVWYPYVQFEAGRGFADLQSMLLLHNIFPANYTDAWCDPSLTLRALTDGPTSAASEATQLQAVASGPPTILAHALTRAHLILDGLPADLNEVAPHPLISVVLLCPLLSSVVALSLSGTRVARWLTRFQGIPTWLRTSGKRQPSFADEHRLETLLLGLLVPRLVLLLVAEPGRPERFFWMWPLQAIFLAAFFTHVFPRWPLPAPLMGLSQVFLLVLLLLNPLQAHLGSWLREGWAGTDPAEVQVVDYVASQVRAEGRGKAAIGYQTFIYPFMAKYKIIDPQYKVGADFDLLFQYGHGIVNTDQCAEGLSPADEYRIVQTRRKAGEDEPKNYFAVSSDNYHSVRRFDLYEVLKRD
jgi:hypothetical protein